MSEGVGSRTVLLESSSPHSGGFVVEESQDEDERGLIRRLVFLESPHLAQTEILMIHKSKRCVVMLQWTDHRPYS